MEKRTFKSNSKEVIQKVREHILDFYDYKDLLSEIEAVKYNGDSVYQAARRLVEGGCFLIYDNDVREFLDGLKLNNKSGKVFFKRRLLEDV